MIVRPYLLAEVAFICYNKGEMSLLLCKDTMSLDLFISKENIVCFTGHRNQKLPWRFNEEDIRCKAKLHPNSIEHLLTDMEIYIVSKLEKSGFLQPSNSKTLEIAVFSLKPQFILNKPPKFVISVAYLVL